MPRPRRAGPRGETASEQIRLRLTPEEKRAIEAAAERAGVTVADYVRDAVLVRIRGSS